MINFLTIHCTVQSPTRQAFVVRYTHFETPQCGLLLFVLRFVEPCTFKNFLLLVFAATGARFAGVQFSILGLYNSLLTST
jgi:hypothetical protein